ncbi:MAG: redoxin domain-containing protein [Candidatus Curtissbacteria bacterium]|nr:redoxin domain-containing protein [Candidatus Curtissbacteria bacterium]
MAAVAFFLAGNSGNDNQSTNGNDHHQEQATQDENKFNALLGNEAPNFTLESFDGKKINLQDLRGKKVVLFFNEGVMCYPACWNQIAAFGKDNAFNNESTSTLVINPDTKNDWKTAVSKMPELASANVLLDSNKNVSREYGVLSLPSSMHKGTMPGHTYLILDKNGVVRFLKDDPQMAVRNDELRKELEKLN